MEEARAWRTMEVVGMEDIDVLYCVLKVAVPQIRGGRMVERRGWVGGILWC